MTAPAARHPANRDAGGRASIVSIAYSLGELRPIEDIDFLRDDPRRLELYRLAGFRSFAHSDLSMRDLARRSAEEALATAAIPRDRIGICLYVAESFDRDEPVCSQEVNRLLVDLGLERAVPMHVSASNCANILAAVRIAVALIATHATEHVLIVSVDKAARRYGGRRMFHDMSIKSDISVTCLISAGDLGRYTITQLMQQNVASLACTDFSNSAAYSMPKFTAIRRIGRDAIDSMNARPQDFVKAITNNYGYPVTRMFLDLCGFSNEAGCFGNIARFAHAVAGDVLINLKDLESAGGLRRGDRIFLLADSISASAVLCLQTR